MGRAVQELDLTPVPTPPIPVFMRHIMLKWCWSSRAKGIPLSQQLHKDLDVTYGRQPR